MLFRSYCACVGVQNPEPGQPCCLGRPVPQGLKRRWYPWKFFLPLDYELPDPDPENGATVYVAGFETNNEVDLEDDA